MPRGRRTDLMAEAKNILTPTLLNRAAKQLLEDNLQRIWVEGEISNLARPASGHLYFSLKDARAQIRCALFRPRSTRLAFRPEDGDRVLVRGKVSLYEVRGDYQLIAEHMEPAGEGALRREFERLKAKLEAEGLFAAELKQDLPPFPKRIGVITSPSAAAFQDVLKVLGRRWPLAPIRLYPTAVQGEQAAAEIAAALRYALQESVCDVLILTRGGGSLEDLWCFNDEQLAREVAASALPVVAAVGHEIDFTLVDFVADLRAPTPSAAAEQVVPNQLDIRQRLSQLHHQLAGAIDRQQKERVQTLDWLTRHLRAQHPRARLDNVAERLTQLHRRLQRVTDQRLDGANRDLKMAAQRLQHVHPQAHAQELHQQLEQLKQRLHLGVRRQQQGRQQQLNQAKALLRLVSPRDLLARGYSILTRSDNGAIVRSTAQLQPGDEITATVADGQISAETRALRSHKK